MVKKITEPRGQYTVGLYEVAINSDMRWAALQFAKRIVLSDNQYSRLLPESIRNANDISLQQKIEIQRTYMGKLGELVFLTLLQSKGKPVNTQGMFEVYDGQENVDSFDFITASGKTIDVKSGFRANHTKLLINVQQFNNAPKDYYVGVKIHAQDTDSRHKLVDWDAITLAVVEEYADCSHLQKYAPTKNFGEGLAKCLPYNQLMGIDHLLAMF